MSDEIGRRLPIKQLEFGQFNYGASNSMAAERTRPPNEAASMFSHDNEARYCDKPSTAKERNFAYFSPIFRASMYSGLARQALTFSMLSQT